MRNIGIALSVFGSFATSGGMVLQKMVKMQVEAQPELGPEFSHFKYIFGLIAVVVGLLCKTAICGLLPQLTLAALSAQSFIYSCILEYLFLNASLSWISIGCIVVAAVGLCLGIIGSGIADVDYSLGALQSMYLRFPAIIFSSSGLAFLIVPRLFLPGRGNELGIMDLVYRVVSSALLAAWFGTFLKAFVEVLMYMTINGGSDLDNHLVGAFVICVLGIVFGISKLRFVAYSQQFFHALLFQPLFQALSVALHIACGVLYFRELSVKYTRGHVELSIYAYGMIALFVGLGAIAMEYDPNVHVISNDGKDDTEKDGLLDTYEDSLRHPPRQGHSGERRRGEMRPQGRDTAPREDVEYGGSGRGGTGRSPARQRYENEYAEDDEIAYQQQQQQRRAAGPLQTGYGTGQDRAQYTGGRGGPSIYDGYNPAYADAGGAQGRGGGQSGQQMPPGGRDAGRRPPAARGGGRAMYTGGLQY